MTSFSKNHSTWPPHNGREFIRSEAFAQTLLSLVKELAAHYPRMDFTDAVALLFEWFDHKLSKNRSFINSTRFRTENAFRAYVKQALWRYALLAERQRQRHEDLTTRVVTRQTISSQATPEELESVREAVVSLPEPHRTVFLRLFLDEEDPSIIADALNLTPRMVSELYEDAVDLLQARLFP